MGLVYTAVAKDDDVVAFCIGLVNLLKKIFQCSRQEGALRGLPARRGSARRLAGLSEGKAFPT